MKEENFPARLHVLVAKEADNAIVIRRGPSKQTCVIGWDRKKNTFKVAQWLKGRIYERRSDISPCGKHWIYFAMNGKWSSDSKGSWSAIARAPWLKAISFFPKGDCWHGGGLFLDDKTYWLNDGYGHDVKQNSSEVSRNAKYTPPYQYGGECLHVYYNKLQRDGWVLIDNIAKSKWSHDTIFEKELSKQWKLLKICHCEIGSPKGKGVYWDEHAVQKGDSEIINFQDWEWADWFDNSIYYASKGQLFKLGIKSNNKLSEPKLLHDFNDYTFEQLQAPY